MVFTRMKRRTQSQTQSSSNIISLLSDWQWVKQLKTALLENRFCLYLQEVPSLTTLDSRRYFEVLLRLRNQDNQLISPSVFIPIAEHYQLMHNINKWVVEHFLDHLLNADPQVWENYRFSLNLSAASLRNYQWFDRLHHALVEFEISPDIICFEISETIALSNLKLASELMIDLQTMGYCFALDDCGSNLSSFQYLQYLPVDYLKIAENFVQNMQHDASDKAIVELINYMGQVLGLQVVAKGVETQETFERVQRMEIDYAQGFYLSRPKPINLSQLA